MRSTLCTLHAKSHKCTYVYVCDSRPQVCQVTSNTGKTCLCLESAVQVSEERMSVAELEDTSFNERTLDVVVF